MEVSRSISPGAEARAGFTRKVWQFGEAHSGGQTHSPVWKEVNKPMLVEDGDSRGTLREKPGDGHMRRCPPLVLTELTQG